MNLQEWYGSLAERERRMVGWGGSAAAALLVVGLVWKLGGAVTAAEERVERRRQDLAFIEAATPHLRARPAARPGESLPIAVDRLAREGGLSQALAGVEPAATGAVRVRFTAAPFDSLVVMLARLQQERGVLAETASVSATTETGLVDATVVLRGR